MKPTVVREQFRTSLIGASSYRHGVLLELHRNQTEDERSEMATKWLNEIGFSKGDATVLTSLAEKLLGGQKLSAKEERTLVERLEKYWRQFIKITIVEIPSVRSTRPPKKRPGARARAKNRRAA